MKEDDTAYGGCGLSMMFLESGLWDGKGGGEGGVRWNRDS